MNTRKIILAGLALMTFGCRSDKATEDSSAWWETEEGTQDGNDDEDKPDDSSGDDDKPNDISYDECGEDFDPTATCEGSWEETICTHDGVIWWCDNGIWLNEDDK